jgi:hypothetical protein
MHNTGLCGVCVSSVLFEFFFFFFFFWYLILFELGFHILVCLLCWNFFMLLFMCGEMIDIAHHLFDEKPIWVQASVL